MISCFFGIWVNSDPLPPPTTPLSKKLTCHTKSLFTPANTMISLYNNNKKIPHTCLQIVAPILKQTETNRKKEDVFLFCFCKSCVNCHMSGATFVCCVSRVTYCLSLTPTATATNPPPDNSPDMHSRLVCKDKPQTVENTQNLHVICQY